MPEHAIDVTIIHGVHAHNRDAAVRLYWHGFGTKLWFVMGPTSVASDFVGDVMSLRQAFSAVDAQGKLVGIIGFRTQYDCFVGGTGRDLRTHYGRFGGIWRGFVLSLVGTALPDGTLDVDGVVVDPSRRGQGIGQALIGALVDHARTQGFDRLRLVVTRKNRRARALYHRLGFRVNRTNFNPLMGVFFGFSYSYTMELDLRSSENLGHASQ